jgi:hypothetical protein
VVRDALVVSIRCGRVLLVLASLSVLVIAPIVIVVVVMRSRRP